MTWISVEDRLPEIDQEVLIYLEKDDDKYIVVAQLSKWCYNQWAYSYGLKGFYDLDPKIEDAIITHWMPLPDKPEIC